MNAIPNPAAFKDATKPVTKSADVISLENKQLLRDNPELVAKAKAIGPNGLSPIATIQYIKQSLMLAENLAQTEVATSNTNASWLQKQNQTAVTPSKAHISQARKADGGGVNGIFATYKNVFYFV